VGGDVWDRQIVVAILAAVVGTNTRFGMICNVIASVSQRSNPLKTKRLLRQKAPRNDFVANKMSAGYQKLSDFF
jgi:hypothetical protein